MKKTSLSSRFVLLSVFGVCLSLYLIYHHQAVVGGFLTGPSACNIGGDFDCDAVAKSEYSTLFGIPVASFGLLYYLGVLLFIFFNRKVSEEKTVPSLFIISLLALFPSIAFFYVSWAIVQKWCLFCSLVHLLNVVMSFIAYRAISAFGGLSSLLEGVKYAFGDFFLSLKGLLYSLVLFGCFVFSVQLPGFITSNFLSAPVEETAIENLYVYWKSQPEVSIPVNTSTDPALRDYIVGNPDAPITVVEFSDFECPFCQRAAGAIKPFVVKNPDLVKLVFKNYPLDPVCIPGNPNLPHQLACRAAMLSRCAGANSQEDFWKMHDAIFGLAREEWSKEALSQLATDMGLDIDTVNRCMSGSAVLDRVKRDVKDGESVGVMSTPSIFIENRLVKFRRLDQLPKLIELIAKRKK